MKRIICLSQQIWPFYLFCIVLSILMPLLELNSASNSGLLFMCAVFGMGGSFLSLLMSKMI